VSKYLSCAETAKLVRQVLKESFPGVKFSVKSKVYSGGASIRIGWVDGPASRLVDAVVDVFEGSYFDGMIDYQGSRYAKLDGEEVHFGASFIFAEREMSQARFERAMGLLRAKYGSQVPELSWESYYQGRAWSAFAGVEWMDRELNVLLSKISSVAAPAKSATLARVKHDGDDGYGRGTVGRDGKGGESCYKAIAEAQARRALEAAQPVGGVQ
jgi:hypothetical protein